MADAAIPERPNPKPVSGVVVPVPLRWPQRLAGLLAHGLLRAVMASWRVRFHDETGLLHDPARGPVIFALWHNRLAVSMSCWRGYVRPRRPGKSLVALISASRDGGLLANVLERLDVTPVRGSSSRRGRQALLETARSIGRGHDVAITPDGPRGPKYQAKDGLLALAQLSGRPIIPTRVSVSRRKELRSWDRFQIPWPGSRCEITFCAPVTVPRDATEEDRRQLADVLKQRMATTPDER